MNYAIIGLGYWGKNYYRIINSNDNINLSAVVDSNQNINLDEGIQHFPDLEHLLNSEISIGAAIVATPTNTHYEITKKLLNNVNYRKITDE